MSDHGFYSDSEEAARCHSSHDPREANHLGPVERDRQIADPLAGRVARGVGDRCGVLARFSDMTSPSWPAPGVARRAAAHYCSLIWRTRL